MRFLSSSTVLLSSSVVVSDISSLYPFKYACDVETETLVPRMSFNAGWLTVICFCSAVRASMCVFWAFGSFFPITSSVSIPNPEASSSNRMTSSWSCSVSQSCFGSSRPLSPGVWVVFSVNVCLRMPVPCHCSGVIAAVKSVLYSFSATGWAVKGLWFVFRSVPVSKICMGMDFPLVHKFASTLHGHQWVGLPLLYYCAGRMPFISVFAGALFFCCGQLRDSLCCGIWSLSVSPPPSSRLSIILLSKMLVVPLNSCGCRCSPGWWGNVTVSGRFCRGCSVRVLRPMWF